MRKTIRRGIFVTATAACALGFGLFQASAATVPTLPALPELPLTSLTNLGQGVALTPNMPTLPTVPGDESRALPGGDLAPGLGDTLSRLPLTSLSQQGVAVIPAGDQSRALPTAGGLAGLGDLTSMLPLGDLAGLGGLTNVTDLTNVGQGLAISPTLPGQSRSSLPAGDLASGLGGLTSLLSLAETTGDLGMPQLGDVPGMTDFVGVPAATDAVAVELPTTADLPTDLPTRDLGLPAVAPSELPVGLDSAQLPQLPKLPTETNEIIKSPIIDLPTDRLPITAQLDHNGVVQKLVPNTEGVDVQGLPKPQVPDVAATSDAVKLPTTTPVTPGMQSVGLPQQLPVVSEAGLPSAPSIHDVTGDLAVPAELPQLPAV